MKKKILFFTAGSVENIPPLRNIPPLFAEHGAKVIVIGYWKPGLRKIETLAHGAVILRVDLRARRIRFAAARKILAVFELLWVGRRILRRMNPDVLVTCDVPAPILNVFASKVPKKIALMLEFHRSRRTLERILIGASNWALKYSDALIVPTLPRLALQFSVRPEFVRKPVFVIPNAPPAQQHGRMPSTINASQAIRFLRGQPDGTIKIVYAGAIGTAHGVDILVRAVDAASGPVSLLILGDKQSKFALELSRVRASLKHSQRILWCDSVPYSELLAVLYCADAGYATYLPESLNDYFAAPGKLYEYLRAGLVVLTDERSCARLALDAFDCGELFPFPASEAGVSAAIERALSRAHALAKRKENAKRLFDMHFDLRQHVHHLVQYLDAPK